MLDVEGNVITADALLCQSAVTEKIIDKKADYVIGLKGNHGRLLEDVALYFKNERIEMSTELLEKGHGRIEPREYFLETEMEWLSQKAEWPGLGAIGAVRSTVEENGKTRQERWYFTTSLKDIEKIEYAVRKHWSIENQLHWNRDVIFGEDASRARKDNSPLNMNVMRKTELSLVRKTGLGNKRLGARKKMYKAALNHEVLSEILFP